MVKTATIAIVLILASISATAQPQKEVINLNKVRDLIIYSDDNFYCAFPSLVTGDKGEILCAFRRAPDRRQLWGAPGYMHVDTNSYLVLVRSKDGGKTWTKDPELIYAHPLGGSQDPCMIRLNDGSIICTSYTWAMLPQQGIDKMKDTTVMHPPYAFLGGYLVRSDDFGTSWKGPFTPPSLPGEATLDCLGKPFPTYNRGAMLQTKDGKVHWAVVRYDNLKPRVTSVHLITSTDRGESWQYSCPIAVDPKISFNETSLIETNKGDIIAFLRTADFDGKLTYARSTDGGKSFGDWQDGVVIGQPFHALRLKDGRIFLVYGYRNEPFGIRAKLLNPDCTDIAEAQEFVIRDDGGSGDIGYPWSTLLPNGNILVAYYYNIKNGTRFIAGSEISISQSP